MARRGAFTGLIYIYTRICIGDTLAVGDYIYIHTFFYAHK